MYVTLNPQTFTKRNGRCVFCHEYLSRIATNTRKEEYLARGKVNTVYTIERRKEYCAICEGMRKQQKDALPMDAQKMPAVAGWLKQGSSNNGW